MLRVADHFERSDTGRQRRGNEDAFYARAPLFAVADGMGGAQAGEVASGLAVEVVERGLPEDGGSVEERLRRIVGEANARINAVARADQQRAGMGTTLTLVYVGEAELSVAHVGDSRLYRLRDGVFERLTDDHSLVEELVRQGKITPQEADEHPQRSIITRALGPEAAVEPDSHTWAARDGDVYLICSDGLTSMVPEARVGELIRGSATLGEAGRTLIDAANAAGGRDNITVVLFVLEEVGAPAGSTPTSEHPAVDAAQAGAGPATAVAAPPQAPDARAEPGDDAAGAQRRPRAPRPGGRAELPDERAEPPRRRRLRVPGGLVASVVLLAIVLLCGWYASQTVYFVGSNEDGFVTVFRGLPYDLPAGLDLYSVNYVSGVPVGELSPRRRRTVTEHELRARDDAHDLVRQMETGELAGR
jgi:serine/threonine protein phosphatase PrpC